MSLNNHLRRHRYKQMLLIHQQQKCCSGGGQLRSISSSRLITTQKLRGNNPSPSLFNTYYKSLLFSTSRVLGNNHSSLSMSSSYYIHNSMIRAPSVVDIVRSLSSKGIVSKTKNASTPTIENNINTRSPSLSFLQKVKIETQYMLQLLQVLIPRILAFVGTLHLTSEYGVQTISCEGPSMEPTIIDGSNTCVLIERWSHRLFGLESRNDNHDHDTVSTEERKKKKILDSTIEEEQEQEENSHNSKETIIIQDEPPKDSWYTLLHGIWKQHFTSGLSNGDVIILHHPGKEATICKRIIGIPGDTIIRTDGGDDEYSSTRRVVPPGHLWIEGDNSLNSLDSRSYGTVPASLVIGKVVCRLWPLREYALLGMDANGVEHWKRVSARIGRGVTKTSFVKGNDKEGSHVLTT